MVISDALQYVALMLACVIITLPLEWVLAARVYRRPRGMLIAISITVLVFSIWDIIAIQAGLWTYSARFTTGIMLPLDYPLEELLFFIAIPLCALLTYEAVGQVLGWVNRKLRPGTPSSRTATHPEPAQEDDRA